MFDHNGMKFLKALLLIILLALLAYAGVSFLSPDRQEGKVERSGVEKPDSVVVGIPERLIDAALQADSTGVDDSVGSPSEAPE